MRFGIKSLVLATLFVLFSAGVAPAEKPSFSGIGASCVSGDPRHICLGLKYVVYQDAAGKPVSTEEAALANLRVMNRLWSQCGISFQIEQFSDVEPTRYGLSFRPSNLSDMDTIRSAFADPTRMLVVTTGAWNRSGTLGETAANAWTAMPTSDPYGSVIEAPVATYSLIYSHEMGHYLNLDHVNRSEDLMNPIIYNRSTRIPAEDCETARSTAERFWTHAIRS